MTVIIDDKNKLKRNVRKITEKSTKLVKRVEFMTNLVLLVATELAQIQYLTKKK